VYPRPEHYVATHTGSINAVCTLEDWTNGVQTFAPGSVFTATKNTTLSAGWGACQFKKSGTVIFELNASKLSAIAEAKVFALAALVKKHDLHHATVLGYSDSLGASHFISSDSTNGVNRRATIEARN
jgi:outer membrane protein OmpA-like peptidoglycan-associated protein